MLHYISELFQERTPEDLTDRIIRDSELPIDCGAFGNVYRCRLRDTSGTPFLVAVKAMRVFAGRPLEQHEKDFRRELGFLNGLEHPNIIPLLGVTYGFGPLPATVSPWMLRGTLRTYLGDNGCVLTMAKRLQLAHGIGSGLQYLHSIAVFHGDLHIGNVLIDDDHNPRITDFGLASTIGKLQPGLSYLERLSYSDKPGAVRWAAPERLAQDFKPHPSADIYSFGCILFQLLCGELPWKEMSDYQVIALKVTNHKLPCRPIDGLVKEVHWELMARCWSSPVERPTASEVVTTLDVFYSRSPGIIPLDKRRFDPTYTVFCQSQNINPGLRVAIGEGRNVDLHQLHVHVMHAGGAQSVTQQDLWAVIGGQLGFVQFPGNASEPDRSGPGIAQQLQNTYEQYLHHFEHAYALASRNRTLRPQPPGTVPMNSGPLVGNNATPDIPGSSSEMPLSPNVPRPIANQQIVAAVARYARSTPDEMRAQRLPDHLIAFVERNRNELMKVYQQQQLQLLAKRNAEQEQQNLANAQGQMLDQASIALQSGIQRPSPNVGMNGMANIPPGDSKMVNGVFTVENVPPPQKVLPPTQEQVQSAMQTIIKLKDMFQTRLGAMAMQQIPDDQRMDYAHLLESVYKTTTDLDGKLHMYLVVSKSEELIRKWVNIVLVVGRQWQLINSHTPQYIINLSTLKTVQVQIQNLNEEFEGRYRAMKNAAAAQQRDLQQRVAISMPPINPPQLTPTSGGGVRPVSVTQPSHQLPAQQGDLQQPSTRPKSRN